MGQEGPRSTPKTLLNFHVCWTWIREMSLKCSLLILQKDELRSAGQKELRMKIFGLFPISSLAMSL